MNEPTESNASSEPTPPGTPTVAPLAWEPSLAPPTATAVPPAAAAGQGEPAATVLLPPGAESKLPQMSGALEIERLSDVELATYFACQEVIRMGWNSFVDVGLALAQIRDQKLYREKFHRFEDYCQARWEYGRRYVNQMISAAQLFTFLGANCSQTRPERESQLRPLVGLSPEQAKLAWERAVEKARGRKITARIVKRALNELQPARSESAKAKPRRRDRAEKQRQISEAFRALLMLLSQKTAHELLTEKVEALHGRCRELFA